MAVFFQVNKENSSNYQTEESIRLANKYLKDSCTRFDLEMLLTDISNKKVDKKTMEKLLFAGATRGDRRLILALIDAKVNPNAQDHLEETALMKCEDYNIALALLEGGAGLSQENKDGQTALLIAAKEGRDHLIDLFMVFGADIAHLDHDGWTALMQASNGSNTTTVQKLLRYCSYKVINHHNKIYHLSALKIAAFNQNLCAVYQLLQRGAYLDERTDHLRLFSLIQKGRIEIIVDERDENIQVIFQELQGNFRHFFMVY